MSPLPPSPHAGLDPERLAAFRAREEQRFARARPVTRARLDEGAEPWLAGVPMHWMRDWPSPFPLVVHRAEKARIEDVDGIEIDDFCLGDTGSMFGHSPPPVARAIRRQARRGLTYMLPSDATLRVGALIRQVFGPMLWQMTLSATDANRHALRVARAVTGRRKVLVFNGCYHGTLEDTMVTCHQGRTVARPGLVGQVLDIAAEAICVEFNDLAAVEAALATGEVAAVLTEPVMTNSCMVLPEAGFHDGLRQLTRHHGTLLILDETHTQSSGLGGYRRVHSLSPDLYVIGKCVAGGIPTGLWGMTPEVAERFAAYDLDRPEGHSGMGTTLSGNPLQVAALEATLSEVMTAKAHDRMERGALRLAAGLEGVIARRALPWHVVRVGARVEFICAPGPLRNGAEAALAHAPEVEAALHLGLLNRGCLIAPFHNMMLVSPVTKTRQIDRLIAAFDEILSELTP
ncbi:aspartate aminotransferase family protein [Pararhodobacter aggregans]|uniref:Aspartate aminotransferase family protein n=1 Tax=Pararhodobacter aggregans TaxID=404875 RepID=A0A2T7UVK1_9RHOB|nr:aspartate aminotransferase family protein [Pararhodobacter aggregans]PTX03912.1 glutamate-1-semialdehyde 2,1-aminomutase [Pararhodobacter aggregans]PVE48611.1 aspartate aminotransferase family protein [Pararhodobacter aggregans]